MEPLYISHQTRVQVEHTPLANLDSERALCCAFMKGVAFIIVL